MSLRLVNVVLLVALVGVVCLYALAGASVTRPNVEVFPGMARSPAYGSYSANPIFADGKTLQEPPPGTAPRGRPPLHYDATPASAARAGQKLRNPFAATDAEAARRGAYVYAQFCQVCHGSEGKGDGPVTLRGVPPPPSQLAEKAVKMPDGQMFHVLTYGQGNMASYAAQLSREDRWRVILHVRALQKRGAAPPKEIRR
jgi:mono/diheme cytochrome c family protein